MNRKRARKLIRNLARHQIQICDDIPRLEYEILGGYTHETSPRGQSKGENKKEIDNNNVEDIINDLMFSYACGEDESFFTDEVCDEFIVDIQK